MPAEFFHRLTEVGNKLRLQNPFDDFLVPDRVEVVFAGRQRRSTFSEVAVRPCETTTIRAWTGAKPAGTPPRWTPRGQTVNGTYTPVAGDFTGDGKPDVVHVSDGGIVTTADQLLSIVREIDSESASWTSEPRIRTLSP